MSVISNKKKQILDYICKVVDTIDHSKSNSKRYKELIEKMSDKEFDDFMKKMKSGEFQLHMTMPNMKSHMDASDLFKAADLVGAKIFHKVWMTDPDTGRKYLTNKEYPVLKVPVRRQQQFLDKKLSVPESDKKIDPLTGQVTMDDKSAALSNPEIQILYSRGLETTLLELIKVRGGDIHAYGEFKRQMEETGEGELNVIDLNSRTRSSVIAGVFIKGMHLENNM